jgi:bifunctional non-homologous end joining protein LigD
VVAPLTDGKEAVAWPAARDFAQVIYSPTARDSPTRYIDTLSKHDRVGRIFLDYLRCDRTPVAIALMSSRACADATIFMPLHCKDVKAGLDLALHILDEARHSHENKEWDRYAQSNRSLAFLHK